MVFNLADPSSFVLSCPLLLHAVLQFRLISRSELWASCLQRLRQWCVCICARGGFFWVNRMWWRRLHRHTKPLWCRGWQSVRDYRQTRSSTVLCAGVQVLYVHLMLLTFPPFAMLKLAYSFCFLLEEKHHFDSNSSSFFNLVAFWG